MRVEIGKIDFYKVKKSFVKLVATPRRIGVAGSLAILMGAGSVGWGITDIGAANQQIDNQITEKMGSLSDAEVAKAKKQLDVENRVLSLVGHSFNPATDVWKKDLRDANVEDLRRRINGLIELGEELKGDQTNQAMEVLALQSQRETYTAKLKEPFTFEDAERLAAIIFGVASVSGGAVYGALRKQASDEMRQSVGLD